VTLRYRRVLSQFVALTGAATLVLSGSQPAAAQPSLGDGAPSAPALQSGFDQESATGLWLVTLDDASIAAYDGDIAGLPATSPSVTGAEELDLGAPASVAYRNHLETTQGEFISAMQDTLDRSVTVPHRYLNALNGLAVEVDAAEAARLAALPGVASVVPDQLKEIQTDASHSLIGTASFWDGETGPGLATRGEGIVVGMLDSGVNPSHPSFAAVSPGDGFVHQNPLGSGNFVGACNPASPNHQPVCNDKLIGAYNFHTGGPNFPSVLDSENHGSHTSSTAAGNLHDASFMVGQTEFTRTIQGVAPRANVISYKVCDEEALCAFSAIVAAVNQGIADGVDVLNYSIGNNINPWASPVSLAFLDAVEAGIFVAAAAGNLGPNPGTVDNDAPWVASAAASSLERVFAHALDITGAPDLQDIAGVPGDGPQVSADITAPIRFLESNPLGCTAFPAGTFDGAVALVQRGSCDFGVKVNNADAAGAVAVVIFNNQLGGPPSAPGALGPAGHDTQIPTVMIDGVTGPILRDHIVDSAPTPTEVTIPAAATMQVRQEWEDVMAGFSSRGPNQLFETLIPTVSGPGVNVLAAAAALGGDPNQYTIIGGTSMSSPHVAGTGALLASLHPEWTPAQINSAITSTADPDPSRQPDGVTPTDPYNEGSGRIDLTQAARVGLTLDETPANFAAANPAIGGDPKTLNLPSFVDHSCGVCSWERTLTGVADAPADYIAVIDAPEGMTVTVTPSEFTVAPGATVDIEVTVDASGLPEGETAFADVQLETPDSHAGGAPIAPVHYPIAVVAEPQQEEAPEITVDPEEITSVQGPDETVTHELTIGNDGNANLNWSVFENGPQRLPQDTTTIPSEAPAGTATGDASLSTKRRLLSGVFGPPKVVTPEPAATQQDEVTITHSASQAIVGLNSVGCSPDNGVTTTENGYLRHFVLDDFGIGSDFGVTQVSFGIETLTVSQAVTVNLYTMINPGGAFVYANFEEIGSATVTLNAQDMTLVSVPVTGTAPAGSTLVVEIDVPDMSGQGALFIGSNPNGQTAPSFLRSASCGLAEPTDTAAIGVPGMHIVMNVTGTAQTETPVCEVPSSTPWVDVAPLSGTVPPAGAQVMEVTFDSTGLSVGDTLEANVCLESNDPANPLVAVPLTLQVEDVAQPAIEVTPESLSAEQTEGEVTEQTLTIGNVGDGTLDWSIFTDEAEGPPTGSTLGTLGTNPDGEAGASAIPDAQPQQDGEVTITHSASQAVVALNSVGCTPGGGVTTENGYLRHFVLEEFDIASEFQVTEVSFGIETINGPPHPVTVNLFTMIDPAGPFVYSNFAPIGSADTTLPAQQLTIVTVPVTGTAPAGSTLVVEVETPDMTANGGGLFIGSNPDGQTAPSFIRSASCEITEPTDLAAIGFPGMHIVMNVTGTTDVEQPVCGVQTEIPWLSVAPDSGSTGAGDSSDVTVTFDSTGLEVGEYEAVLCVASNDPANPLVQVPVALSVVEDGGGPVVCDETITGVHSGPLTVSEGVTCLAAGSQVLGEINVAQGAGLIATAAVVQGPISAIGASVVNIVFSQVTGPVLVAGATGDVSLFASQVTGSVSLLNNTTGAAPSTVSGNTVIGSLSCFGNTPAPTHHGLSNTATGGKLGQCAEL
jgi:subtilisin family serine protease